MTTIMTDEVAGALRAAQLFVKAAAEDPQRHPQQQAGSQVLVNQIDRLLDAQRTGLLRDGCQLCKGMKGGVPGNENRQYHLVVCDYCSALIGSIENIVRDDTLRGAARLACLVAGDMKTFVTSPVAEVLQSVRIKDGKWQSEHAMVLWGHATSRDGEMLHEQYDGNGRPRHG